MKSKEIKKLSEKIMLNEYNRFLGKNIKSSEKNIEIIMSSLKFEDVVEVDNYIMTHWAEFKKEQENKDLKGEN